MRNFFRNIAVGVLLLAAGSAEAQQNTIFRIKAEGQYAWLLGSEAGSNAYGGEAALELPLYGNHNWEYTYNFPTVGFSMGYLRAESSEYDRHIIPVVTYFHYPVVHTKGFALNLKWGSGLAGLVPAKGTDYDYFPLTGVWQLGLNMDIALSTRYGKPAAQWMITLGGNVQAYHNGHITRKTKNAILANAQLGLKYTPNVWPLPIKYPARSVEHTLALEAYAAGAVNQLEEEDKYRPNGVLCVGAYVPISNAYRLGLSVDGFYNGSYDGTQRTNNIRYNFIKEDKFINKIRVGVALANELTMSKRVSAGVHVGVYCLNKIKVPKHNELGEENGNLIENILYTKFVTRFYFTPKFFIVVDLKSHLNKVECANVGLGWAMPDFGKRIKNPFARISFKKEDREELRITGSEK